MLPRRLQANRSHGFDAGRAVRLWTSHRLWMLDLTMRGLTMRAASSPIDLNIAPRTAATPRKPAASTNAQVFAHLAVSPWTAMRPQGQLIHAPASAGRADDARAEARRTALSATRSRPARSGRQNVIPLVVPLARFSAWMARIQADASRRRRRMAAPFRDDQGPSTIAPHPGPHEIAPAIRGGVVW